jgi:hypothetical protein
MSLRVSSPAFKNGASVPPQYTCDGRDVSPPLAWRGQPEATRSFAITCDDPDAPSGTFTHWVLYNVPPTVAALAEGARGIGADGVNGFHRKGYGGPCPPPGAAHRYVFHVYALDVESVGKPGLSKTQAAVAMAGHVVAEGEIIGTYARAAGKSAGGTVTRST